MNISVVIPTVSRPHDLRRLLVSILQNTRLPDEIIIVEQGTVAETTALVADLETSVPMLVVPLAVKSLSSARNAGIQHASGDIVSFLDDDMEVRESHFADLELFFKENQDALGVTGTYLPEGTPAFTFKKLIGILFRVYSLRSRNAVLRSGANDHIRGRHLQEVQTVAWMYGGNMSYRASVFAQGFSFDERFIRWAYGEDVQLSYQIHKRFPGSLWYLPALRAIHHEGKGGKLVNAQVIRMKILYRYLFWKREVRRNVADTLAYLWSQIGLAGFDLLSYPRLQTVRVLAQSFWYVFRNRKAMLDDAIDYNAFILSKPPQELWRVSVFGKFPFVRLKQIVSNPPYLWYFLKRFFYYKHVSDRFIPLYAGFRFLTPRETLEKIIRERLSLARFNDGEFGILVGAGIYPPDSDWSQRYSAALRDRMGAVLGSQNNQVLVAVPDPSIFLATRKEARERGVLHSMWTEARMNLHHYLHRSREYGNSNVFIPEHHPDLPWEKLYDFLRTKDVVIVTGGTENLRHVQLGRRTYFVEAGKHNAFERYETIVTDLKTLIEREGLSKESTLIMASLGPTADILALDLTDEGYQVWDTGHFFKFTSAKFLSMRSV